jgi:hypothetical protein
MVEIPVKHEIGEGNMKVNAMMVGAIAVALAMVALLGGSQRAPAEVRSPARAGRSTSTRCCITRASRA